MFPFSFVDTSSTSRPVAQHAKKSIPTELKGKLSSDENDENLTSPVSSNSKEEISVNVKEPIKSEENQSATSMSTKDGSGEFCLNLPKVFFIYILFPSRQIPVGVPITTKYSTAEWHKKNIF